MSYETKQGDHGPEIWEDGERIVFTNDSGNWQAVHGKSSQKADALAWYDETAGGSDEDATDHIGESTQKVDQGTGDLLEGKDPATPEPRTDVDQVTKQPKPAKGGAKAATLAEIDEVLPSCPIPEDPRKGDKTPGVIAWWFKNHPEIAEKKYSGRRYSKP